MRPGASDAEIIADALASGIERTFMAELAGLVRGVGDGKPPPAAAAGGAVESGASGALVGGGALVLNAQADAPLVTADVLRARLTASLGAERFGLAKAALTDAARGDGDGDDALAGGGVQQLFGEGLYEEALPLMLKLIYLEEWSRRNAPR